MIELYEKSYLRICYDAPLRLLEVEWRGNDATAADMRAGFWQALLLGERYQVRAWLGDLRGLPPILPAEQRWLHQEWFPRYLQLALEKVAIVNSTDQASRQSVTDVIEATSLIKLGNRPETRYFDSVEAAREWIRTPLVITQLPSRG